MKPNSNSNSNSDSNGENSVAWQEVVQMVFDAMHSNGVIRNHLSSIHLPVSNGSANGGIIHGGTGNGSPANILVDDTDESSTHLNGSGGVDSWQRKPLLNHEHSTEPASEWVYAKESHSHSNSQADFYSDGVVKINVPSPEREEPKFPREKWKTFIAFVFLSANWILTTLVLAIVHERLPDRSKNPPLPDIVFDLVEPVTWGLPVSEILIMIATITCLIIVLMHKYSFIIFRRMFLILGLLYLMRIITMFVTQVPVASVTYYCSPKANSTSPILVLKRALQLMSGFGLTINGQHTFCGDYIYSGHTVMLTMTHLVIHEYTPRRCFILHWLSWITSFVGIVLVLISRGHYTVDVVIAYYVTTRLFWIYHTMANNIILKTTGPNNYLSRLWWFSMFRYFESNVNGVVPRQYEWPLTWPRRFLPRHPRNS